MNTRRLTTQLTLLATLAALAALAGYSALAPTPAQAHHAPYDCMVDDYIATQYHLQLVEGSTSDDAGEIAGKNGGKVVRAFDLHSSQPGFFLEFPCLDEDPSMLPEKMDLLIERIESDKRVVHLIPDSVTHNVPRS